MPSHNFGDKKFSAQTRNVPFPPSLPSCTLQHTHPQRMSSHTLMRTMTSDRSPKSRTRNHADSVANPKPRPEYRP